MGGFPASRCTQPLLIGLVVALLGFATLLGQDNAQPSRDQRIQVDVNLVTVRFTVKDGRGEFINSLGKDQFRISENGQYKDIAFFEPPNKYW